MLAACPEADLKAGNLSKQCQAHVGALQANLGGYYGYSLVGSL